jgi:MFS family permease
MQQCPLGTLDVFLGVFLAAVDGTIVSTAMPTVVGALAVFPLSIGWTGTSMLSGWVVHRIGQRRIAVAGRRSR